MVLYNVMYHRPFNTTASHARVVGGSSRKIMTYPHTRNWGGSALTTVMVLVTSQTPPMTSLDANVAVFSHDHNRN